MTRVNRIVWGILLLFGAFVIHESLDLSYYGTDFGPGPGFFSFWLGVLVIVVSVIQIAGTLRRPAEPLPGDFIPNRDGVKRMLYVFGALLASLLLMNRLGFSLNNSMFDVGVMILCGLLGYVLKKLDFPLAPAILTLILGPLMERSLRVSLSLSQGDYSIFFTRPISLLFLIVTAIILATSAWQALPSAVREESKEAEV
jgi:hypothetical protein